MVEEIVNVKLNSRQFFYIETGQGLDKELPEIFD